MLAEMPMGGEEGWRPDPEEVARRKDLRKSHLVMSIDPKGKQLYLQEIEL